MNRRIAIALMAAGVLPSRLGVAQHHAGRIVSGKAYKPQFFSAGEHRLIDSLSELILPADAHSPGASAARAADFIDLLVSNSSAANQQQWRQGIEAANSFAQQRFQKAAHSMAPAELLALLNAGAEQESQPATALGRFFVALKQATLRAYYTSQVGIRNELRYDGPAAMGRFPGC